MDLRLSFFLVGVAYAAIPLTVWYILRSRDVSGSATYWCLGNGLFAITLMLMGTRAFVPEWLGYSVASAVGYLSYSLRYVSLLEGARAIKDKIVPVIYFAAFLGIGGFFLDWWVGYQRNSVLINSVVQALFCAAIAWQAYRVYRYEDQRDYLLIVAGYVLMVAALLFRTAVLDIDISRTGVSGHESSIFIVFTAALACVILSNIGYVGHALKRYEDLLSSNQAKLVNEQKKRGEIERAAQEKQNLLDELSSMLNQREVLTQNLVSEILKPMQRISSSLEFLSSTLRKREGNEELLPVLNRFETFLRRVSTSATNAVTHARFLQDKSDVYRQEIEIHLISNLILADLSHEERLRIRTNQAVRSQTIRIDFELFRIAILNLVSRALEHGDGRNQLEIRVEEIESPAMLMWDIRSEPELGAALAGDQWWEVSPEHGMQRVLQPSDDLGCRVAHEAISMHSGELFKLETTDSIRFLIRIPYE